MSRFSFKFVSDMHRRLPLDGTWLTDILGSRIPASTTAEAVVKSILSQLFNKSIGDLRIYQVLADAFGRVKKAIDGGAYENILWATLGSALKAVRKSAQDLVLVVDGVDKANYGESAMLKRLKEAASNADHLKLIVLGAQRQAETTSQAVLQITTGRTFDDIAAVVRQAFQHRHAFSRLPSEELEQNVARIVEAANDSFLWAKLASEHIGDEASPDALAAPNVDRYTIKDLVSSSIANLSEDGKKMLSWVATAVRPLSVQELSCLASIQPEKGIVAERHVDPHYALRPVQSLIYFDKNLVYLRHGQIRAAVLGTIPEGKSVPVARNRNFDLARRLLLYAKKYVAVDQEPSITPLDRQVTRSVLEKYPLADFALRYWAEYTSTAFGCTTDQEISAAARELRDVLPTSVTVPLLGMTVWRNKSTPVLRSLHGIQSRMYQQCLTDTHPATLQALICQALFHHGIRDSPHVLYNAVMASVKVLSNRHYITMRMAKLFLEDTAENVSDSRTEVMVGRVDVLEVLAEYYKVHFGTASDLVISTLTELSEHYQSINEEPKAQEILASLPTAPVETAAEKATGPQLSGDSLLVHLHSQRDTEKGAIPFTLDKVEDAESIPWSYDYDALVNEAQRHVAQGSLEAAERTYVELWQHAIRRHRLQYSTESELISIKAGVAYATFLESQGRDNGAASVLLSVWEECVHAASSSESVVSQLVSAANLMKSVGLIGSSLSVLRYCERNCSSESGVYDEIQQHIQSTLSEAMETINRSADVMAESILRDMAFNTSTADRFFAAATDALVKSYMSQHRWHDATETIKRALQRVWPEILASSLQDVKLPSKNVDYCVGLAEKLGRCYYLQHRAGDEEDIRARLYRATRHSRPVDDELLDRVTTETLRLYERTLQTDKTIAIHKETLNGYVESFGWEHPMVIKTLWTLAELSRPHPISVDYYRQIADVLNKDSEVCHPDAFEPLSIVATDLLSQGRYTHALGPSRILFNTLQHPTARRSFQDHTAVTAIYERYLKCLHAVQSDITAIHDATGQYRKACLALFGPTARITIEATMTLANICRESEQYEAEAIQLYEDLLETRTGEVHIDRAETQAMLDSMYDRQIAVVLSLGSAESVSSEKLRKLVTIGSERLSSLQTNYGWAHEKTLYQLEVATSLLTMQGDLQAVSSLLSEVTSKVLSTESSSAKLVLGARKIASLYVAFGQAHRANEFVQQLYRQIVFQDTSAGLDFTPIQRHGLAFLAQFECSLREDSSVTLNQILSSLTTEYLYFEQLTADMKARPSSFQNVIATASRLHGHLLDSGRRPADAHLVGQLANYFLAEEGSGLEANNSQAQLFISSILEYFGRYESQDFLRSIAIASYRRVTELLGVQDYQSACGLALTSFNYICARHGNSSLDIMKVTFNLGLIISGRGIKPRPESPARKDMLSVSATIMRNVLNTMRATNVDLTGLDAATLNSLVGLLHEQKDYHNLAWVLSSLWDSRDTHSLSQQQHDYTLALGRMLIITQYLTGNYAAAIQLAEGIAYNCARVRGARDPGVAELTVLLSQMYASVAYGYQNQKDSRDLAYRYYKKAAFLHEGALRSFMDPATASATAEIDESSSSSSEAGSHPPGEVDSDQGNQVRQHLQHLKLVVERMGAWPKDYKEYEQLNSDLFKTFADDLKGVSGMDKWRLGRSESGKAEAIDDSIIPMLDQEVSKFAISV
jgi:hypothetical protein